MTVFVISVICVLIISALCSLTEAALYAVRVPYIRQIAERGSRPGKVLAAFKENMERPISAILIVNTAANTAGAAVAGAQARVLFGETALLWFSLLFTLGVLFVSEIIPKVIGVVYSRPVARTLALPWAAIIAVLYPLIWCIGHISRWIKPRDPILAAPEEEVHQMAMISAEEGSILPYEAELVRNVLRLDNLKARDIMTPRPVVFKLPSDMKLTDVAPKVEDCSFSRIPVYMSDDPETWKGFVFTREVLAGLARDEFENQLSELCQPIYFVSEETRGHVLLRMFLRRRTHLFGVVDDFGDITGIVTLEDVLEALIGEEIVDEADAAVDMQEVARRRSREHFGKRGASDTPGQEAKNGDAAS